MNDLNRRTFLRYGGVLLGALAIPSCLVSCAGFSPQPFVTGGEVEPPHGCKVLRSENPEGDC